MKLGMEVLLADSQLTKKLKGKKIALLGHPASMIFSQSPNNHPRWAFSHSLDALKANSNINLCVAFGPQHGMRGEKQDNMMETETYLDPIHQIPIFSLYGEVRRPTSEMMKTFDVLIVDLQDVGTRVYTFLTTLFYVIEECARHQKSIWICDRPNPAGRPTEGTLLDFKNWGSFVGAAEIPMRHGLTFVEAAKWYVQNQKLDLDIHYVHMKDYSLDNAPGFGWPEGELPWINPSPNASTLSMARCYPGTVLLEGTHFSEGRGTTRPLEMMGAPDIDGLKVLRKMDSIAQEWMQGCRLRPFYFQPTFQKHVGKICSGFQIHVDDSHYHHTQFKPYRLIALAFKAVRGLYPDYSIWRDFHYEYEKDRLAIDLISGGEFLRKWVDDPQAEPGDFETLLLNDETHWTQERKEFLVY